MKPLILISNDDGISARGINTLAEHLADLGEIWVVAPNRERSASSHALTLDRPLRAVEHQPGWWAIDGTPADCIYLAALHLLPRAPDLVVSGINHGYNLGSDFFYSGTVAAAVEAAIRGFKSFAISLGRGQDKEGFVAAAKFARALAHAILAEGLPTKTLLNVNVPNSGPLRGYQWTRLGQQVYRDQVDMRTDLRGRRYYWIGGPEVEAEAAPGSDVAAVKSGLASVTPLDLDLTSHGLIDSLPGWHLDGFEAILAQAGTPEKSGLQ